MRETRSDLMIYDPAYAVAPGDSLKEALEEREMSQAELAERTGLSRKTINGILQGREPITNATAIKFEQVLGYPARVWIKLEAGYREQLARIEYRENTLKPSEDWYARQRFPISELIKREIIKRTLNKLGEFEQVLKFFGVSSPDRWEAAWARGAVAWRRSAKAKAAPGAVAAWLRLAELKSLEIACEQYDRDKFLDAVKRIRSLTVKGPEVFQPQMIDLCRSAGVALVFEPEIKGCPASGAARWLKPDRALIVLSLRYKRDDQLWFSFFHEAGHILNGKKKAFYVDTDDGVNAEGAEASEEDRANRFAARLLIPEEYESELPSLLTEPAVRAFARRLGIAPGIVAGRLQRERILPYDRRWVSGLKKKLCWRQR